jgi:hypothetical protein
VYWWIWNSGREEVLPQGIVSKPSKFYAATISAALSLLFMIVYGGCNWITAHRSDVGTWYYSWESFIPFVPVMIIPYMSIDLFFVCGPFLCQSRNEFRVLAQRITFAILVAGACFLLIPLRFSAVRPQPGDWRVQFLDFYISSTSPITCFRRCTLPFAPFSLLYTQNTQKASSVWHLTCGLF